MKIFSQNNFKGFQPDVWLEPNEKYRGYAYGMSSQIPSRCIQNYTLENDIVYDPFMGSGTTAIAAIRTNRQYIGSEINVDYVNLCEQRISEENNNLSTLTGN